MAEKSFFRGLRLSFELKIMAENPLGRQVKGLDDSTLKYLMTEGFRSLKTATAVVLFIIIIIIIIIIMITIIAMYFSVRVCVYVY